MRVFCVFIGNKFRNLSLQTHYNAFVPQKIYLGLGSNLGDRQAHLDAAVAALAPSVRLLRNSPIYETAPWGFTDQPAFLNQVLEAETDFEPKELLALLKATEKQLGRQDRFRNGPREIDIDILLIDDLVLNEDRLRVPHPGLHERAFILTPLAEVAPDLIIPGQQQSVKKLLSALDTSGIRLYHP
jgi:2-amino-4-hydroxy-6-hydroxymethyldihydropteridine diphosphokinase